MVGLRGETVHDNHDKHPADQMRCTAAAGRSIVMDLQNICCSYLFQWLYLKNTTNESALFSCSSFACVNFKVPVVLRGFGEIGEGR